MLDFPVIQGSCFANDCLIFTFRFCLYPLKFSTQPLLWKFIEVILELGHILLYHTGLMCSTSHVRSNSEDITNTRTKTGFQCSWIRQDRYKGTWCDSSPVHSLEAGKLHACDTPVQEWEKWMMISDEAALVPSSSLVSSPVAHCDLSRQKLK